jgi:UDP-N-acetylmuramoylalanine--D-glutamate ligase
MGNVSGLSGVKVAVIGLGASGVAAARLALERQGVVYVSDLDTDAQAAARGAHLRELGADVQVGGHDLERVASADLVVASPGIPPDAPVLRALADRGKRWISEPELAVRFYRGSLIAITGTNGKTTTSMLTAHLLETAGHSVALGGNVGGGMAPAAAELALLEPAPEWYVLELSSFQLAGIETLRPDIGVVTNLSPDHLDRYASLDAYYADKARLFDNADEDSRWVLPLGDASVDDLIEDAPGTRFRFGGSADSESNAFVHDGTLTLRTAAESETLLSEADIPLLGRHNRLNALTAALTARLAGASIDGIAEGLRTTQPLRHRLEPVVEREGVLWVNDSKATNVAATRSALESLERPVVLLAGGKDKGEDFRGMRESLAGVRTAVVFGAAADRLAGELDGAVELVRMEADFSEVVHAAKGLAHYGDIVLLSPACSSFDMFDDYEDRGRRFADLAREIA